MKRYEEAEHHFILLTCCNTACYCLRMKSEDLLPKFSFVIDLPGAVGWSIRRRLMPCLAVADGRLSGSKPIVSKYQTYDLRTLSL